MKCIRFYCLTVLIIIIVSVFYGCGTETALTYNGELVGNGKWEPLIVSEEALSDRMTAAAEEAAISRQISLDILPQIQIEAGAELKAADLFKEYTDQEVIFNTKLSGDELAEAGAVYEVDVTYLEHSVTVTVEIVDTTPPVIEGVSKLWATVGTSVSYKKNIQVSDNAAGEVVLNVDNSSVDLDTPGTYPVYYTAIDASGNQTKAETVVTVTKPEGPTEEAAAAMADKVIADVITGDMTQYDTAYALWKWCRNNMRYVNRAVDYENVWEGAYEGLKLRKGDCYTYCATYSYLLTRCGIENMSVSRVGGLTEHKWNLVNVGSGWYHCDSSPRRTGDSYECFMQTDAQVQVYTASYPEKPNYYVFDESLYPERAATVIYGTDPGN